MAIDPADVGQLTMRFIDHIAGEYGDEAVLVRTMIIAEVHYPDTEDPELNHRTILWDTDEVSPAAKVGLVQFVAATLLP